ncbi:MAG: exclusion suppressor FxsA [Alphaproteobacteria bacterium HGW-Alphaproteobacteria-12]|nr:MAG: exclusion suppressor FxsA [Alphaproteobacteria bacterium HGW-Alphaproteobacteria-12]
MWAKPVPHPIFMASTGAARRSNLPEPSRKSALPAFIFLIFIAVPLIEIAIFIEVGGAIGVWPTVGIVLLTALLGATLLRVQGLATWRRAEEAMRRGEPPVAEMLDGVFLIAAALLMVTPGLFTDCAGILLLIPPVRRAIGQFAARRIAASSRFTVYRSGMNRGPNMDPGGFGPGGRGPAPSRRGPVIEGEAEEIDGNGGEPRGTGADPSSPWRQ